MVGARLLSASDVSARLGVDRSTVYRMATDGRLEAVKVGGQWRFPPAVIDGALSPVLATTALDAADALVPVGAASTAVLRAAAAVLDAMMLVTDMDGNLVTEVVNPCPWFDAHGQDPEVLEACTIRWRAMAADEVFTPRLDVGPHGFACVRSFVRRGDKLVGMVVATGIGPDPDDPEGAREAGFHHLDVHQREQLLDALPRVAASLSGLTRPGDTTT